MSQVETLQTELAEFEARHATLSEAAAALEDKLESAKSSDDISAMATFRSRQSATAEALQGIEARIKKKRREVAAAIEAEQKDELWQQLSTVRGAENEKREKMNDDIAEMNARVEQAFSAAQERLRLASTAQADICAALGLGQADFHREATAREAGGQLVPLLALDTGGVAFHELHSRSYREAMELARQAELEASDAHARRRNEVEAKREKESQERRIAHAEQRRNEAEQQAKGAARLAAIDAEYSKAGWR